MSGHASYMRLLGISNKHFRPKRLRQQEAWPVLPKNVQTVCYYSKSIVSHSLPKVCYVLEILLCTICASKSNSSNNIINHSDFKWEYDFYWRFFCLDNKIAVMLSHLPNRWDWEQKVWKDKEMMGKREREDNTSRSCCIIESYPAPSANPTS